MNIPGLISIFLLFTQTCAFYLPGVAPTDYKENDKVPLLVNSLSQLFVYGSGSMISYDYYFKAFKFCTPPDGPPKQQSESLGAILLGDRIWNSPFELFMLKNESCKTLCTSHYQGRDIDFIKRRVIEMYGHSWLVDGLPAAYEMVDAETDQKWVLARMPLGEPVWASDDEPRYIFYNHYDITIDYHAIKNNAYRVVGVTVNPSSRKNNLDSCNSTGAVEFTENKDQELDVTFTYSVTWKPSNVLWATRWDRYLKGYDSDIHYFSLINSIVIVAFLTILVTTILLRALRKDIARYNEIDLSEEIREDSGWKLIHGDIFRAPKRRQLLSVLVGSGSQLLAMVAFTLTFAALGFLSPSNRGSFSTVMILCYVFFGVIGGFMSARTYRIFGGESWKTNLILTPTLIPGIIFISVLFVNFFLIFSRASGAVPFGTLVFLVLLWFIVSVPLSAVGSIYAYKTQIPQPPLRTNQIPRQIPIQPRYLRPIASTLISGILPYEAIFVELYFIMTSYWTHQFYYMFGFLFICFLLLLVTSSCVSVALTYFSLCAENYHWQWRSFIFSGASSIYIFLHAMYYMITRLSLGGFVSITVYVIYSLLLSLVFFILTGTVGFIACYYFVRRIYGSIKID